MSSFDKEGYFKIGDICDNFSVSGKTPDFIDRLMVIGVSSTSTRDFNRLVGIGSNAHVLVGDVRNNFLTSSEVAGLKHVKWHLNDIMSVCLVSGWIIWVWTLSYSSSNAWCGLRGEGGGVWTQNTPKKRRGHRGRYNVKNVQYVTLEGHVALLKNTLWETIWQKYHCFRHFWNGMAIGTVTMAINGSPSFRKRDCQLIYIIRNRVWSATALDILCQFKYDEISINNQIMKYFCIKLKRIQ